MDEMTYSDDRVIALMNQRYIAVRVDQDSRPALRSRCRMRTSRSSGSIARKVRCPDRR
jgi:uncharacterized protein YyaL (SSP411 family)